jgi:transposase-like protein
MKYSPERKEAVLKKMLPPHNRALSELAREEGISEATLYLWRKEARRQGRLLPNGDQGPEGWTSRDKFAAVVETASLSEVELGEYCRRRGLYPEQIRAWRLACEQAHDGDRGQQRRLKASQQTDQKRLCELERELQRKEKAPAETAALLVLRKKAEAIWGDREDDGSAPKNRRQAVELIQDAVQSGARRAQACAALGLSLRTYQRWVQEGGVKADGRPLAKRPEPSNKLSAEERARVLEGLSCAGVCPSPAKPNRASAGRPGCVSRLGVERLPASAGRR